MHSGWCIIFAINKVKLELSNKVKIRITVSVLLGKGKNQCNEYQ